MTAQQTFRNTLIVLGTLAVTYALLLSIRIIVVLFVAIIIASALRPAVLWLEKRGLSYGLSILLVYLVLFFAIFGLLVLVLPPAAQRLAVFIENEDRLAGRIIGAQTWLESQIERFSDTDITLLDPESIRTTVNGLVSQLRRTAPDIAGELGALLGDFVLAVVIGIYWLTSRDQAVNTLLSLFSLRRRGEVEEVVDEIESSLGAYVRGVATVVTIVGVANFIPLLLLGVPNAVTIAFVIGISTALPVIGGFIGAAFGVLLALLSSPVYALMVLVTFVLVQQVEVHWLTPRTMARSVNINPILIIVMIFIGFALGGVVGGILSVPISGAIYILVRHLIIEPRQEENAPIRMEGGVLLEKPKEPPDGEGGILLPTESAPGR